MNNKIYREKSLDLLERGIGALEKIASTMKNSAPVTSGMDTTDKEDEENEMCQDEEDLCMKCKKGKKLTLWSICYSCLVEHLRE